MAINFIRIDDRLIHGQVVTTWVKLKKIEQILIINDIIAQDEIQKNVFQMMAPQGVKIQTFGVEQFATIIQTNEIKRNTMLLFTNPIDVLAFHNKGMKVETLNVGGMKYESNRTQLAKAVFVNDEERVAFHALIDAGVDVTIQMTPNDTKKELNELL